MIFAPGSSLSNPDLIQSNQKYRALRRLRIMGDFFGAFSIVILYPDTYPPIPHRAAEASHLGAVITAGKLAGEFFGSIFFVKGANLNPPASALIEWRRRMQYFHPHHGNPHLPDVYFLGR